MFTLFLSQQYWIDLLAVIGMIVVGVFWIMAWSDRRQKKALIHNDHLLHMRQEIYEKYEKNFFSS